MTCGQPLYARGVCRKCYNRAWRKGEITPLGRVVAQGRLAV